jgi:hypothetical protein
MALFQGLRLHLIIDGIQQITQTEISADFDSNNQPLETLEGLVGFTPGAKRVTITGSQVVPVGGLEFDFVAASDDQGVHSMQIPIGQKSYIGDGVFSKCTVSQSTGKATEVQFTWVGLMSPFK